MNSIYQDKIITILKNSSVFFSEKNNHYIIRCPYCGDSKKRLNTGHLYISQTIPVFRCNRCSKGGSIFKLLKYLSFEHLDPKTDIFSDNAFSFDNLQYNYTKKINSYAADSDYQLEYKNIVQSYNENVYHEKIKYLSDRVNINTDTLLSDSYISNKIIIDTKYLIENNIPIQNRIAECYRSPNLIQYITNNLINNYIAFLGVNKNIIIFRNITTSKYRYFKLNINVQQKDYFVIDKLDQIEKIPTLVIAEGPFDILVPYFHSTNDNFVSRMYTCASSNNFSDAVKFIAVTKTIPIFNVILLADNDLPDIVYNKFYRSTKRFINSLKVIKNIKEKDFGGKELDPITCRIF